MTIQILGGGCPNCQALEQNARQAAQRLGLDVTIEKVTDSDEILEMGALRTPGYAIDGTLQSSGKVSTVDEIEAALGSFAKVEN
jgi:small redox-active disulfide protein 2